MYYKNEPLLKRIVSILCILILDTLYYDKFNIWNLELYIPKFTNLKISKNFGTHIHFKDFENYEMFITLEYFYKTTIFNKIHHLPI